MFNTLMGEEELNMMATLRMNRKFVEYMRSTYGQKLSKQPFGMTLVKVDKRQDKQDASCDVLMIVDRKISKRTLMIFSSS